MNNCRSISSITPNKIRRAPCGYPELDWLYGYTESSIGPLWGLPEAKISLWCGEGGVGKSRLAISVAKNYALANVNILYFQTETSLEDFAGWVDNPQNYDNFYCSNSSKTVSICKDIRSIAPSIVFIDSVNEIEEFENGNKKESRQLITALRDVCRDIKCHIILLAQLNQDKTIKGGTSLPHLADITFKLEHNSKDPDGKFKMFPIKHRYGRIGNASTSEWEHTNIGVNCISTSREYDNIWCDSFGVSLKKRLVSIAPDKKEELLMDVMPITDEIKENVAWAMKKTKKKKFSWRNFLSL